MPSEYYVLNTDGTVEVKSVVKPPLMPTVYDEPAYALAMLALQSDRYGRDPEYRAATDNVLATYGIGQAARKHSMFETFKACIDCRVMEHVSVLYRGKEAHLYVDEDGNSKKLPVNFRASRIYANYMLSQSDHDDEIYDEVTADPPSENIFVTGGGRPLTIVGRAILWTGPRV